MTRLGKASHWAVIGLCLVAGLVLIDQRLRPSGQRPAKTVAPGNLVGKKIALGGVSWHEANTNIVIAVTSHCPFCARSMPFYRHLSRSGGERRGGVKLFVVSSEATAVIERVLAAENVLPDGVLQVPLASLGISKTPTLLVVGGNGAVWNEFTGLLTESGEAEVARAIRGRFKTEH